MANISIFYAFGLQKLIEIWYRRINMIKATSFRELFLKIFFPRLRGNP